MARAKDSHRRNDATERFRCEMDELRRQIRDLNEQLSAARETISYLSKRLRAPDDGSPAHVNDDVRALSRQIERQSMILERDKAIARKLQDSVRPVWLTDFEGVEFCAQSKTGTRVGGDFYDVIKISDTVLGLMIADVSGYGLPAAVIMATARMAFRTFATTESSPKAIMERGNQALLESTLAGHHLTAFMGLLDVEMLTFQYVNASHCPPYLIRGDEILPLDTEGLFVGMFEDPRYEQKCIQLERNDKLFLFTDGLVRMFNGTCPKEKALTRIQGILRECSDASVQEVVHRMSQHVIEEPEDDVLILALQLLRQRARRKTISVPSLPSEVARVEDTILPALAAKGYGERALFAVKLALEEAVINAIKHGNQLDSTKKVSVDFALDDDKAVVTVADEGEGFDPASIPDPTKEENLDSVYGRGIVLMRAYMDSVEYSEKGNAVTMTKYAPWHPRNKTEKD